MKLLDTPGYATAMAQAALNDGIDPQGYAAGYGLNLSAKDGYPIRAYNPATGQYVDYMVNGRYDGYINAKRTMRFSDTDWLDEISRTGFSQNYDAAVSTSGEKGSSFFSSAIRKQRYIEIYRFRESLLE